MKKPLFLICLLFYSTTIFSSEQQVTLTSIDGVQIVGICGSNYSGNSYGTNQFMQKSAGDYYAFTEFYGQSTAITVTDRMARVKYATQPGGVLSSLVNVCCYYSCNIGRNYAMTVGGITFIAYTNNTSYGRDAYYRFG